MYTSSSMKVRPCLSGSLMAPLFSLVRRVHLNIPPPPIHTHTHLHSESGNRLGVARGKKRCRIWSYHRTTRNTQRKAFIWPQPPVLGSLWQECGWWEGWSSECSGWIKWLGGGEPQRRGLVIFEPPWLAYAKTNHINFDRRLRELTVGMCVCKTKTLGILQTTLPHFFLFFQPDHLSVGYSITTTRDTQQHAP